MAPTPLSKKHPLAKLKSSTTSSFRLRCPSLNSLRLRRIFDLFDKNNDGIITSDELSQALNVLGLDVDLYELHSTLDLYVQQGNTGLTFDDFRALHQSLDDKFFAGGEENIESDSPCENETQDSDLSEAFKVFDEDGDGYISAKELQVVLGKLGLPEAKEIDRVKQMIVSVDRNHDGQVDFFEFKHMMSTVLVNSS